ncbi:MAG: hypothetical protein V2G48_07945 [bacterium JZ-2024 1]
MKVAPFAYGAMLVGAVEGGVWAMPIPGFFTRKGGMKRNDGREKKWRVRK